MKKKAIIVHGGAGPDSQFIREHLEEIKKGIENAIQAGYEVLEKEGKAIDAVEAAIKVLENDPHFNAGRGSALNDKGEVEMCASLMEGKDHSSGAAAIVKSVKHPVSLAKAIMQNTNYVYMGGEEAVNYAKEVDLELEPDAYFITEHEYDKYAGKRADARESGRDAVLKKAGMHGTVGAVALDMEGNIAAATSTGGTTYCKAGRIGDSSIIGAGTYADNKTCGVSASGDGEYLIRGVIARSISCYMAYKKHDVEKACKEIIHVENKDIDGDIGAIVLDAEGNFAAEFNSERMIRGWKVGNDKPTVKIYRE